MQILLFINIARLGAPAVSACLARPTHCENGSMTPLIAGAILSQRPIVFSSNGGRIRAGTASLLHKHPLNLPQVIHIMPRKHPHNMLHRLLTALRMHPVVLPLLRRQ